MANVVVIGFVVLLVAGGSRFAIGLVLKPMAEDLDWPRTVLGAAAAAFLVITSLSTFWSGKLADTVNIRGVLAIGLAFSVLGLVSIYFVAAPWQMIIVYGVIFAIGNGLASVTLIGVMVSRWFPGRLATANAVAVSGIGFGQLIVIGMLATFLARLDWQWIFAGLGVAHLMLLPLLLLNAPYRKLQIALGQSSDENPRETTLRHALATGALWRLTLIYAICGFQDFFVATHIVALALDSGVGSQPAGNLLAVMGLASAMGVLYAGLWSDRFGPKPAVLWCFVLRLGVFAMILVDQSELIVIMFGLVFGLTFLQTAPLAVVFVRDSFGFANLGVISGLIVMLHQMSGGLGAYVGALAFELNGNYDVALAVMLFLSIIAVAASATLPARVASRPA